MCTVSYAGMYFEGREGVTCVIDGTYVSDARISIGQDNYIFICQNLKDGRDASDKLGYKYSWVVGENGDFVNGTNNVTDLRVIDTDVLFVEVGDILLDREGVERKVLAVCYQTFLPSNQFDIDMANSEWWTFKNAKKQGWKIKRDDALFSIGDKKVSIQTIKEALKAYFK